MAMLLKDVVRPNLVQTLGNNSVFVHDDPLANITHGYNPVVTTITVIKSPTIQ